MCPQDAGARRLGTGTSRYRRSVRLVSEVKAPRKAWRENQPDRGNRQAAYGTVKCLSAQHDFFARLIFRAFLRVVSLFPAGALSVGRGRIQVRSATLSRLS